MTGGRRGLCSNPSSQAGTIGYGYGRGGRAWGCGRGFGRGRGFGYARFGETTISKDEEKAMLQSEADALKASLESIQKRIAQLESDSSE